MKSYKKWKFKQTKKALVFITVFISVQGSFAQKCLFKRDTVIIVSFNYTQKNNQPLLIEGVIKELPCFQFKEKNADSIIKQFYREAIFIKEPLISIESNLKCFNDTSEAKLSYVNTLQLLSEKFGKFDEAIILKCKKRTVLNISFSRIIADFWIISTDFSEINSLSIGYPLNQSIYKHNVYYGMKQLFDVLPLSPMEKGVIQNFR